MAIRKKRESEKAVAGPAKSDGEDAKSDDDDAKSDDDDAKSASGSGFEGCSDTDVEAEPKAKTSVGGLESTNVIRGDASKSAAEAKVESSSSSSSSSDSD